MHPKAPVDPFSKAFSALIWDSEVFTTISAPFNAFSMASSPPGALSIAKILDFGGAKCLFTSSRGESEGEDMQQVGLRYI
jgi:hypothetical protein